MCLQARKQRMINGTTGWVTWIRSRSASYLQWPDDWSVRWQMILIFVRVKLWSSNLNYTLQWNKSQISKTITVGTHRCMRENETIWKKILQFDELTVMSTSFEIQSTVKMWVISDGSRLTKYRLPSQIQQLWSHLQAEVWGYETPGTSRSERVYDVDYSETYSPVARLPTIRLLLAAEIIEEKVFLKPPEDDNVREYQQIALWSQSPKCWNDRFHKFWLFVRSLTTVCTQSSSMVSISI